MRCRNNVRGEGWGGQEKQMKDEGIRKRGDKEIKKRFLQCGRTRKKCGDNAEKYKIKKGYVKDNDNMY